MRGRHRTLHLRAARLASVAAALVLAGCGNDDPEIGLGASDATLPSAPTNSDLATPLPESSAPASPAPDAECATDRRTLEVALEAYYATVGAWPVDQANLVAAGLLRAEFASYDVVAGTGEVVRVSGAACLSDDPSSGSADPSISSTGCPADAQLLEAALEVFLIRFGEYPSSRADLMGTMLFDDIPSFEVLPGGRLVLVPGVPCTFESLEPEPPAAAPSTREEALAIFGAYGAVLMGGVDCATELADLVVAGVRYQEETGSRAADFDTLAPYLDQPLVFWRWDADTDMPAAVEGSGCLDAGFVDTGDRPSPCETELRTFEVAIEAYLAENGRLPDNEQELIDAGMIREGSDQYDVVYGEIVLGDDSTCSLG